MGHWAGGAVRPGRRRRVLAALEALRGQEGWADVQWMGRLLDHQEADLMAARLRGPRPDPHARPPLSQAELACRAAQAAEIRRRWHE